MATGIFAEARAKASFASSSSTPSISYRILPGLPAIFPNAHSADGTVAEDIVTTNGAGTYAEPGVYTMYVQYVLLEHQ